MSYLIAHNGASIYGGCERWTVSTLAALQQRGRKVKLICNHEIVAQQARAHGVPVQIVPLRGDLLLSDVARAAYVLRREHPDVVLFTTFKKIWLGGMAARMARVPRTVLRVGLSTDVPRNMKYRVALRWIDDVIVNAPDIAAAYPGATVIPNGVPTPNVTLDGRVFRDQHDIANDAFVIASISRMSRQKRIDRLLDALALLPPNAIAAIAGGGGRSAEIQAYAEQKGVAGRVRFLGQRDDVGNVLNAADAFVASSDLEGMSHALLEALALGVPIVSTPVSGAKHVLGDVAGIVVEDFTPRALANGIEQLMASAALRAQLATTARIRYQEQFTFERMVAAYDQALFQT